MQAQATAIQKQENWAKRVQALVIEQPAWAGALICTLVFLTLTVPRLGLKSMSLDEAVFANVTVRENFSPSALETAPAPYLFVVSLLTHVLGTSDIVFRLLPLFFGVGAVYILYHLVYRFSQSALTALIGSLLFATNMALISYSMMLHPYSGDMFFAVALIGIADRLAGKSTRRTVWIILYLAVAAIALLFSFPSPFVLTTTSAVVGMTLLRRQHIRELLWFICGHILLAIEYGVYLSAILLLEQRQLTKIFTSDFPPSSGPISVVKWYARQSIELLLYFFGSSTWLYAPFTPLAHGGMKLVAFVGRIATVGAAPILIAIGAYYLFAVRWEPRRFILLIGPLALVALAALLHVYNFDARGAGRTLLFACPGLLILLVLGLHHLIRMRFVVRLPLLIGIAMILLFIPPILTVGNAIAHPLESARGVDVEETRDLITKILQPDLRRGDLIYVYYGAADAFQHYMPAYMQPAPIWGIERTVTHHGITVLFGARMPNRFGDYRREIMQAANRDEARRLWLVFGRRSIPIPTQTRVDEETGIISALRACTAVTQEWHRTGAGLYLVAVPWKPCS